MWRALTDPARLPEWFSGARDVEADAEYPHVGSSIRWRVGPWRFEGRVVECDPPRLLRQSTRSGSGDAIITHRLVPEVDGRVRYEKEVAVTWRGRLWRTIGPAIVAPSVRKEATRIARIAERSAEGAEPPR